MFFSAYTWGADVASACCSLQQRGSPRPSRPLLKIIDSILLLFLLLLDWLLNHHCLMMNFPLRTHICFLRLRPCSNWGLPDLAVEVLPRSRKKAQARGMQRGCMEATLDRILVVRPFESEPLDQVLRVDRDAVQRRRRGATGWQRIGSGPQERQKDPSCKEANFIKVGPMHALSLYHLGIFRWHVTHT